MDRSNRFPAISEHDYQELPEGIPKSLCIPKRRSSLRSARSGNLSTFDLTDLRLSLDVCISEQGAQRGKTGITEQDEGPGSSPILSLSLAESPASVGVTAVFSPGSASSTATTPDGCSQNRPLASSRCEASPLSTPTRRRAICHGTVTDTPPKSTDRFIPTRSRGEISISKYRASKTSSELSPEQRQAKLDRAAYDPFMTRRVTPHLGIRRNASGNQISNSRAMSASGIWNIGGSAAHQNTLAAVYTGRGAVLESGTNARMFSSDFFNRESAQESSERFEGRLAMALDLDRSGRILELQFAGGVKKATTAPRTTIWRDGQWLTYKRNNFLDAPSLRDDFYCTLLAYCPAAKKLAVALKNRVYLWTETKGVENQPRSDPEGIRCHITSLSYSSPGAGKGVLAIGRSDGRINLWCVNENFDRIEHTLPASIACLAFRPVSTRRFSTRTHCVTSMEDLLVGDDKGTVYYYTIEWPELGQSTQQTSMVLLAKLNLHEHQVCGLAWSPDGEYFASGGNDNICYLFTAREVLGGSAQREVAIKTPKYPRMSPDAPEFIPSQALHHTIGLRNDPRKGQARLTIRTSLEEQLRGAWDHVVCNGPLVARHRWIHTAAVKAIAFCPWQKGLIATGGGSNDRAIHFFHISSGACLATITVYAQVTSLMWSKTKREICATFGYSAPDHPFRIAVFSWPDCRQIVRIPWKDNMRALYAIPYPGGPNEENKSVGGKSKGKVKEKNSEGGVWWSRTKEEGCIVVACSDQSVKFHEIWSGHSSAIGPRSGGLAWSSILESEEGGDVEFDGDNVIR